MGQTYNVTMSRHIVYGTSTKITSEDKRQHTKPIKQFANETPNFSMYPFVAVSSYIFQLHIAPTTPKYIQIQLNAVEIEVYKKNKGHCHD